MEEDLLPHLDGTERGLVVMMCGLPGSGKSTHAQALERRDDTRLSIDEVVWARTGRDAAGLDPVEYEQHKAAIEQELWEELIRLMEARLPVVIDYSFWSRATRDRCKAAIESHGCRWELVRLKADLETLRRRLADRNQRNDANSITVSDDLLERHFAAFEEPNGEGERVIVQEQLPRPLPRARPRVRQAPARVGRKEKEGELPLLSDDCGAGAQVDTQARRGAGVVVVP